MTRQSDKPPCDPCSACALDSPLWRCLPRGSDHWIVYPFRSRRCRAIARRGVARDEGIGLPECDSDQQYQRHDSRQEGGFAFHFSTQTDVRIIQTRAARRCQWKVATAKSPIQVTRPLYRLRKKEG